MYTQHTPEAPQARIRQLHGPPTHTLNKRADVWCTALPSHPGGCGPSQAQGPMAFLARHPPPNLARASARRCYDSGLVQQAGSNGSGQCTTPPIRKLASRCPHTCFYGNFPRSAAALLRWRQKAAGTCLAGHKVTNEPAWPPEPRDHWRAPSFSEGLKSPCRHGPMQQATTESPRHGG